MIFQTETWTLALSNGFPLHSLLRPLVFFILCPLWCWIYILLYHVRVALFLCVCRNVRVAMCFWAHVHVSLCVTCLISSLSEASSILNLPPFNLLPPSAFIKCTHLSALFLQFFKTSFASYLSVSESPSSFSSSFSCSPHLVFNHPPHAYLSFNEHLSPSHAAVAHPTEPWTCLRCHVWFCVC